MRMASNRPGQPTSSVVTIPDDSKPPEYAAESDIPFRTKCNNCHTIVETNIVNKVGPFTWIACILLASFGFFLGCCFVPFCLKSAKDIVHTCTNCQAEIGRHSRF